MLKTSNWDVSADPYVVSEIRKSEILPSEFCPISGEEGELWVPNLARMSQIECY